MGAYLGLRDGWFWEDDAILDAIETLQGQADGTFYPTEYGPEGHTDIARPDLWGYLIPKEQSEPFERLFAAREDEQVAKLYGTRFAYARWYNGADGEPKVGFLPAPVSREEPLAGGVGEKATWARFWTWGPALEEHRHELRSGHGLVRNRVRLQETRPSRRQVQGCRGQTRALCNHRRRRPLWRAQGKPVDDLRRFLLELHPRD